MSENSGRIYKKTAPFTMTSNYMITDSNLSTKAKGLYVMIAYYTNIPNFELYRTNLEKMIPEGEKAFRSMWNELKEKGYLVVHKKNSPTGFIYEYELFDVPVNCSSDKNDSSSSNQQKKKVTKKIRSLENKQQTLPVKNDDSSDINEIIKDEIFDDGEYFPSSLKRTSGECTSGISTGGEGHTINNNKSKKTLSNNTIYNNLSINDLNIDSEFISQTDNDKMDMIRYDIKNNSNNYSFDDYYEFAFQQVDAANAEIYVNYTDKKKEAISEWVTAMANIYSTISDTIQIGKTIEKTITAKQKLLKLDPYCFAGILIYFTDYSGRVNNVDAYMKKTLLNASSSRGVNQSHAQNMLNNL